MFLCIRIFLLSMFVVSTLFTQTYSYEEGYEKQAKNSSRPLSTEEQSKLRDDIVRLTYYYLDKGYKYNEKVLVSNDIQNKAKHFLFDCSGFVAATFWSANIVVFEKQSQVSQTGTTTIYNTLKRFGKIYRENPQKGDIIFFNRTTKSEKPLSHVIIIA